MMLEAYAAIAPKNEQVAILLDTPAGRVPLSVEEAKTLLDQLQQAIKEANHAE